MNKDCANISPFAGVGKKQICGSFQRKIQIIEIRMVFFAKTLQKYMTAPLREINNSTTFKALNPPFIISK